MFPYLVFQGCTLISSTLKKPLFFDRAFKLSPQLEIKSTFYVEKSHLLIYKENQ